VPTGLRGVTCDAWRVNRIDVDGHDIVGLVAGNAGPLTLSGTNTWVVGREPTWVIDPGPNLAEHLDAVSAEIDVREGLGAILLTHRHLDHADAAWELARRFAPVPVAAVRDPVRHAHEAAAAAAAAAANRSHQPAFAAPARIDLHDGDRIGPLTVLAMPGHTPDHIAFLTDDGVLFSGDAVAGSGSVFVAPDPGALAGYLAALQRARDRHPRLIAPGHGPLVLDADAKLGEYIDHRLARERALVEALGRGLRRVDELLAAAWPGTPWELQTAATITLAAHLDKLADEGRLPPGVERPKVAWRAAE